MQQMFVINLITGVLTADIKLLNALMQCWKMCYNESRLLCFSKC